MPLEDALAIINRYRSAAYNIDIATIATKHSIRSITERDRWRHHITFSVGIAELPQGSNATDVLATFTRADDSLYLVKNESRDAIAHSVGGVPRLIRGSAGTGPSGAHQLPLPFDTGWMPGHPVSTPSRQVGLNTPISPAA